MHITVYLTVKLHRSFNCNFTSIYNSVIVKVVKAVIVVVPIDVLFKKYNSPF